MADPNTDTSKIHHYNSMVYAHLSKRPNDLKQNGTQEKTPFVGTVFYTLSHGAFRFVVSVNFINL